MTFPYSAWGPDGRSVVKREGPIAKTSLYNGGYVPTPRELARRRKISSPEASPTAGRANPTLGNLLHAGMCGECAE